MTPFLRCTSIVGTNVGVECHRQSRGVRWFLNMDEHIVCTGLFMGFVDKKGKGPYPVTIITSDGGSGEMLHLFDSVALTHGTFCLASTGI